VIGRNVVIRHPHRIVLGDNVIVDDNAVLDAKGNRDVSIRIGSDAIIGRNTILSCKQMAEQSGTIELGERANISVNCTLISESRLAIGARVLVAGHVYIIAGGNHGIDRTDIPILEQPMVHKGGVAIEDDCWLGAGAGIAGGILLVAGIIAGTAGREAWQLVLWPILLVLRGLNYLVDWIVLALALIAYIIFLPIFWVVQRLIQDRDEPDFVQETGEVLEPAAETPGPIEVLPDPVLQVLQWAIVAGIILFVIWFALRQLRKRQIAKSEDDEYEVRESVWSKDALMNDLSEMLRSLRPDWTRRRGGINLRRAPETVRDAYRYTLVHAGRQGYARVLNESPIRYSTRLKSTEPAVSDPLDDLTERYLRARYAEQTSEEDVQIAREDWEAIRERLRRQQNRERGE
jgi:acetyltransferase-like isoleucine patch superfamily enzyme